MAISIKPNHTYILLEKFATKDTKFLSIPLERDSNSVTFILYISAETQSSHKMPCNVETIASAISKEVGNRI